MTQSPSPAAPTSGYTCIGCHYPLTGLSPQGNCPECGVPIAQSIQFANPGFTNIDLQWLKQRYAGYIVCEALLLILGLAWLGEAFLHWQTVYHGLGSTLILAPRGHVIGYTMAICAPAYLYVAIAFRKPSPCARHSSLGGPFASLLIFAAALCTLVSFALLAHHLGHLPNPQNGHAIGYVYQVHRMLLPFVSAVFLVDALLLAIVSKRRSSIIWLALLSLYGLLTFPIGYFINFLAGEYIFNQRGPNPMNPADAFGATLACADTALIGLFHLSCIIGIYLLARDIHTGIKENAPLPPQTPTPA